MFNWFLRLISVPVVKKLAGSLTRTALASLAGFLAASGVPQELVDPLNQSIPIAQEVAIAAAVALYSLVQIWSIKQKVD